MKKLLLALITLLGVTGAFAQVLPCNIQFTVTSQPGTTQTVTLTNNSMFTTIPGSVPSMWIQWGDNSTLSIPHTAGLSYNHTYANAGNYIITVGAMHYDSINNVMICSSTDTQLVSLYAPCATSITKVNNGGGSYTFTANNMGGGTGITYTWNFGDGSPTVTGSPVTHTYSMTGNYTCSVTAVAPFCAAGTSTLVSVFNGTLNCAQLVANFNSSGSGYNKTFTNTSTPINNIPGASIKRVANWDFGDASTATTSFALINHMYAAAGTYTVTLINIWVDSVSNTVYCSDTISKPVTVTTPPPPPNVISGYIFWDSSNAPTISQASFKVWLITYDATTNMLNAIDSQTVSGYFSAQYSFSGYPSGSYRTKAAALAGTAAAGTLLPTYHDSTLYWNTALVINHSGGSSTNKNIKMKQGVNTGGPGFIGGNVSQGANKGTGAGVPNLLVSLLDQSNNVIRFTYTDVNGDYTFGNLPLGSYIVFPESMNYLTTPSSVLHIVSGQTSVAGINFKHTSTEIKPITTGVDNVPNSNLFSIYPNPTKGIIQINWKPGMSSKVCISILDMTGRVMMYHITNGTGPSNLNLDQLQNGIYFIKVVNGDAQHAEKIVLQY